MVKTISDGKTWTAGGFFRAAAKTELGREKPRRRQKPVGGREKPPPAGRPAARACLVVANYTQGGVGKTAAGGQNRSIATPARGPAPAKYNVATKKKLLQFPSSADTHMHAVSVCRVDL